MKEIQLTQGQVAIVDDEDYELLNSHRWYAAWAPGTESFYVIRKSPRVLRKRRTIHMHREIMGATKGEYVDHINHDTLDNRKENLRLCSNSQNHANQRMVVMNTSGFKGVSWYKALGKWQARLRADQKLRHIGFFKTALDAALAYDREALKTFGEFALTNQMLGLIPANK